MGRAVLVVNPHASRVDERRTEAVARALAVDEVLRTRRPGHAVELVEAACRRADRIYVFAGDGGFNEALNGSDGRVPLGFVPGGAKNVLTRALGLPRDPVAAARGLAAGKTRRISVGRVNGRRFGFAAGIGLDAELVRRVDAMGRSASGRRPGDLAFARAAVAALARRRFRLEPALEVAGLGRAAFVLVANADPYTYAGPVRVRVARGARLELGLDVVAPPALRPRDYPAVARYLATGRGLELLRAGDLDRIDVRCDEPMPLQADGEDLGDVEEAVFEAERDAIAVLVQRAGRVDSP